MNYSLQRANKGFTLVETMIVVSISAVMLGMMMYRHSFTLTRATYNQDVEFFAASLKEVGTTAKKLGYLIFDSDANDDTKGGTESLSRANETLSDLGDSKYCVWVFREKNTKGSVVNRSSGVISHRSFVSVKVSEGYTNDANKNIKTGSYVDLYLDDNPNMDINTSNKPDARIIFQPNMLPYRPGTVQIGLQEGKSVDIERWQRIDIERSGAITVNTVDKDSRLNEVDLDKKDA